MDIPLEIQFHGVDKSEAVEARVREKVTRLQKHCDRLVSCRVVIEAPHRHNHKGRIYHIKVLLGVPGSADLVVNNEPGTDHSHEDVYVALRDAFAAARRRLEDFMEKRGRK